MKKIILSLLTAIFCITAVFAKDAEINPKQGYKSLAWGSSIAMAKMNGYELVPVDAEFLASEQKVYKEPIKIFVLKDPLDKGVSGVLLYYDSNDKLFQAGEFLTKALCTPAKLAARYGKFGNDGIIAISKNEFTDAIVEEDGSISMNIGITIFGDDGAALLYDWNKASKISRKLLAMSGKATIADNLNELAENLLKNTERSTKISMAFVALTSDNSNKFVENYVTDALTQAVFECGNIKIIERANLEKILSEQKFQSSMLVDDNSAKSIGKIAGVDYVCYGDMKDIGEEITVNARIVDVETGEVISISRSTVKKDTYLRDYAATQKKIEEEKIQKAEQEKKAQAERVAKAKWEVTKNRNEFDEYTTYTFICRTTTGQFCFVGYDKYDNSMYSVVRAGFRWSENPDIVRLTSGYGLGGTFEIKCDDGGIYKTTRFYSDDRASWSFKSGWKTNNSYDFYFTYDKKLDVKELINVFGNNKVLAVRSSSYDFVKRFETAMFWEVLAANGITREEIYAAIDNEKF